MSRNSVRTRFTGPADIQCTPPDEGQKFPSTSRTLCLENGYAFLADRAAAMRYLTEKISRRARDCVDTHQGINFTYCHGGSTVLRLTMKI